MKKILKLCLVIIILLGFSNISSKIVNAEGEIIKFGAHTIYEPIAEAAKKVLEEAGYEVELTLLSDNIQLNEGLNDGTFDVNFHQHELYMNEFNKSKDSDLVKVEEGLFRQLIGLFSLNIKEISEIQDGDLIAIQNDPTNIDRAMKVLSDAGLIEIDPEALESGDLLTDLDIQENPLNLELVKVEGPALVKSMEDTIAGVITGVHIAEAGFSGEDALATYTRDDVSDYDIILATKKGHEKEDKILAVFEALQTEEVLTSVEETFKGSWIPVFELNKE